MAFDAATHLHNLSMHGPEIPLTPENRALVWAELYRRMGEPQPLEAPEPKKSTEGEECGNL
jgi:hypothetical protein